MKTFFLMIWYIIVFTYITQNFIFTGWRANYPLKIFLSSHELLKASFKTSESMFTVIDIARNDINLPIYSRLLPDLTSMPPTRQNILHKWNIHHVIGYVTRCDTHARKSGLAGTLQAFAAFPFTVRSQSLIQNSDCILVRCPGIVQSRSVVISSRVCNGYSQSPRIVVSVVSYASRTGDYTGSA